MVNPYLEKSVATTKKLQVIITRMVEFEKDIQDYVDSADYPAEKLADIMEEQNKPHTEETQLLAMVNDLLYRLMDYQRNKEKCIFLPIDREMCISQRKIEKCIYLPI